MTVDYNQIILDLKGKRESIDTAIQAIEALIAGGLDDTEMGLASRKRHRTRGHHDAERQDTVANLAYAVIEHNGHPMKVADISRVLEDMGRFRGARRTTSNYATVYGCLSNDRRFVRVGEAEFDLRERVMP